MVETPLRRCLMLAVIGAMVLLFLPRSDVGASTYRKPVSQAIRAGCGSDWHRVSSPSPGTFNTLRGVSGVSQNDAWAVGDADGFSLALHWDGQNWATTTSPQATGTLYAVHALTSTDVWAVGVGFPDPTMHWNGASWTSFPTTGFDGTLRGVDGATSTDVWAVGNIQDNSGVFQPAILQWTGAAWSVVSGAPVTYGGSLQAVDVVTATDVWAVGYQYLSDLHTQQPFIEHWDGVDWTESPSQPPFGSGFFSGVSGISGTNVWAVGTKEPNASRSLTLAERWDGSSWTIVPTVDLGTTENDLAAVVTIKPGSAIAAGSYRGNGGFVVPMVQHWNGERWGGMAAFFRPTGNTYFLGLDVIGSVRWAVGTFQPPSAISSTLIEASCSS